MANILTNAKTNILYFIHLALLKPLPWPALMLCNTAQNTHSYCAVYVTVSCVSLSSDCMLLMYFNTSTDNRTIDTWFHSRLDDTFLMAEMYFTINDWFASTTISVPIKNIECQVPTSCSSILTDNLVGRQPWRSIFQFRRTKSRIQFYNLFWLISLLSTTKKKFP